MCWLCDIRSRQFEAEQREAAGSSAGEAGTAQDAPTSGAAGREASPEQGVSGAQVPSLIEPSRSEG